MELKNGSIFVVALVVLLVVISVWIINGNSELLNQSIAQINSTDSSVAYKKDLLIKKLTKKVKADEKEIAVLKVAVNAARAAKPVQVAAPVQ